MSISTSAPGHSATTQNLIALSQDIAALLSLSIESGASLLHDVYRRALSGVGLGEAHPHRPLTSAGSSGEGGRGMAVVVIGAGEPTGQALSLHLAKSGYTVFSLMPLPSPLSPPTSAALSSLLLTWSRMQKRAKARFPNHPGSVVPIITDPESDDSSPSMTSPSDLKGKGRYAHAGETVRAYCHEQNLALVAIVCATRAPRPSIQVGIPTPAPSPPRSKGRVKFIDDVPTPSEHSSTPGYSSQSGMDLSIAPALRPLHPGSLALTDDHTLLSLYRANIIEPLALVRELRDLLSICADNGKGRSRVIFVNGAEGGSFENGARRMENSSVVSSTMEGAMRIINTARTETARLLRAELGHVGIDVCEVLVGPMTPRTGIPGFHLRHSSDESNDSGSGRKKLIDDALKPTNDNDGQAQTEDVDCKQMVIAQRLALISRIWAVDDALLFSAVRRAIEDRYPRYRHHAGLSPLVASIAEITPGAGIVRMIGRWLVARLLTPRM